MAFLKMLSLFFVLAISTKLLESEAKSLANVHRLLTADEIEKVFGSAAQDVPEYDVTHPFQVDHRGEFLSNDVTHGNDDTTTIKRNLFFRITAFNEVLYLNVSLNTEDLFSPDFVAEVRNNGSSRLSSNVPNCHYAGHVVSSEGLGPNVAISNCDGLSGMIRSKRGVIMVSPLPKRLSINQNNKRPHVVYKLSKRNAEAMIRRLGVDKREDTWCGVKAPNQALKKETGIPEEFADVVSDSTDGKQYTIEALVVADQKMTQFHGVEQLKIYIPTLINIVQGLLADSTIGVNIKYVLNKLQILETDETGLVINSHGAKTLSSFCRWTSKENRGDDTNPEHFDHAALISRVSFCSNNVDARSPRCKSLLGLANLEGMCVPDTSCTLNKDTGLGTAFTIAHETAHNLGAEHDGEGNNCPDGVNIMATKASGKATAFEWSACSVKYITKFLRGHTSKCLNDRPGRSVSLPKTLAGQKYSLDDQCRRMIKGSSGVCKQIDKTGPITCYQLWCDKGDSCTTINEPAAEGSSCGLRKWCRRGVCVPFGKEGPKAVDGGYSRWSRWGRCSHSCGGGVKIRTRQCNNPAPKNGGRLCKGDSKQFQYCVNKKCPSSVPDTRMTQCRSKHNEVFQGGRKYKWVYNPKASVSKKERCSLMCEAPLRFSEVTFFNFGNVKDGTKCNGHGPNGVCVEGVCKLVGCDNIFGSTAKKDRCGVCNGDGSSCSDNTITKVFNKTPDPDGWDYQTIAKIPVGARNIEIRELRRSPNILSLITLDEEPITDEYIQPNRKYEFKAAGTKFELIERRGKERITAKGPLTEAISLEYEVVDWDKKYKVLYKYSKTGYPSRLVSREVEVSRDDTGYKWIIKSQGCSVDCGGGKILVLAMCVGGDNAVPVSRELCSEQEMPEQLAITNCNSHPCKPRWDVGEWGDCSKTCNDGSLGQQQREVMCVIKSKGVDELVDDSECQRPKPAMVRECGRNECPAEWNTVKSGPCSTTCGKGIQTLTVICKKTGTNGKSYREPDEKCPKDDKPPTTVTCHAGVPCEA